MKHLPDVNLLSSGHVTDHYLADLADKHGCKLTTLDQGLKHRATVIVS